MDAGGRLPIHREGVRIMGLTIIVLLAMAGLAMGQSPEPGLSVAYTDSSGAEVLIVHPEVGVAIDPPERERYGLFRDVAGFSQAQYVRQPSGDYEIWLVTQDAGGREVRTVEPTSEEAVLYVHRKIASAVEVLTGDEMARALMDSVSAGALDQLTRALNPVVAPEAKRLILSPTASSLPQGEGYFSDHWLFFPAVAYGVQDRLSLLGGMTLFPGLAVEEQMFYLGTKSQLHRTESTRTSVGIVLFGQQDVEDRFGIVYGVSTLGGADGRLTVLLGYGFEGTDLAERPVVVVGGEKRVGRRTFFISEVPFYDAKPIFPFFGIRRYSEDGHSHWDVGYPLVGYVIGFGG
jgi:hypothetical protein